LRHYLEICLGARVALKPTPIIPLPSLFMKRDLLTSSNVKELVAPSVKLLAAIDNENVLQNTHHRCFQIEKRSGEIKTTFYGLQLEN
jgi:hypothetical protein